MKVGIGSDHRGYKLKGFLINYLSKLGYEVFDYGTDSTNSTDYPIYAFKLCEGINRDIELGILICGTGIGMSIAANKVKGIRCAKVSSLKEAKLSKEHNNANVISISENMSKRKAKKIIKSFLETEFSNLEKHIKRIKMVDDYVTKL